MRLERCMHIVCALYMNVLWPEALMSRDIIIMTPPQAPAHCEQWLNTGGIHHNLSLEQKSIVDENCLYTKLSHQICTEHTIYNYCVHNTISSGCF